jgi:hypothetical protein
VTRTRDGTDEFEIVIVDGEVTKQMRVAYDRFWQLLIGRMINEGKLKPKRPKVTTKIKKVKARLC